MAVHNVLAMLLPGGGPGGWKPRTAHVRDKFTKTTTEHRRRGELRSRGGKEPGKQNEEEWEGNVQRVMRGPR